MPAPTNNRSLLADLGVIGLESIEPIVMAALIAGEPLLLIGPHGTGKSYLLNRLCEALGLDWRHYNASLLNFDDLVGYPLPDAKGSLQFVRTPASIWDAQVAFIDEISRCRPDLQNKLFPIIHERRVQGILLDKLIYRWSAMNPPPSDSAESEEENGYRGSEPLDLALADRFAFIVAMPSWSELSEQQQESVILSGSAAVDGRAASRLRGLIASGKSLLPQIHEKLAGKLAGYIRIVADLLREGHIDLSPRRLAILLRNVLAVHTARVLKAADADLAESALTTLLHSIPERAVGRPVNTVKLLTAHREAWKAASIGQLDPRHAVMLERDPVKRVFLAAQVQTISSLDFSVIVADALAALPLGGRHALACALFDSGHAGRLVAAVAEQCGQLCTAATNPQDLNESNFNGSRRHGTWRQIEATLARLPKNDVETEMLGNLLTSLFAANKTTTEPDVDKIASDWQENRAKIREVLS